MKALIFGGTRFMGKYVSEALLNAGWEVSIANRKSPENRFMRISIIDRGHDSLREI